MLCDTVKEIARRAGATVLGSDQIIQIARNEKKKDNDEKIIAEDRKGRIISTNENKAIEGVNYIISELESDRPIVVGVSHRPR